MNRLTIIFATLTIVIHVLVFVIESVLWLTPVIYERALRKLNAAVDIDLAQQALVLDVLFFNQGFYNLFLALGGIAGLWLYQRQRTQAGVVLVAYMCCFALGASLVLAYSTTAYLGVVLQGGPPLIALISMGWRKHAQSTAKNVL